MKAVNIKLILGSLIVMAGLVEESARGACQHLQQGLDAKMREYREYRDRNLERQTQLQASKLECDQRGSAISQRALAAASAEACTAQGEVASLDESITSLGLNCESKYAELKSLQTQLKAAYAIVHEDLKGALDFINDDPTMPKYCGPEMEVANTMGQAFLALEGNIVDTLNLATTGTANYASLKETGRQLSARLSAGNRNCNESLPAGNVQPNRMLATTYGQGAATVTPIGESPRPVSDISGTQKAIDDNARAEALIGK